MERARNLFEFLRQAQMLRSTPVRAASSYEKVLWLSDLPEHGAIDSCHRIADPEVGNPLFSIGRVPREDPPEPDDELRPWLSSTYDDVDEVPKLRDEIPAQLVPALDPRQTDEGPEPVLRSEDHPDLAEAFEVWLARWNAWAEVERDRLAVRQVYGELFQSYVTATSRTEEFELVLGVGCLSWHPDDHPQVQRHAFTCPVSIQLDSDTGRLNVTADSGLQPLTLELDMLDPGLIQNQQHVNALKARLEEFDSHPLHRDEIASATRQLVNSLDADGSYLDDDVAAPIRSSLVGSYAPALILRKRSQRGMVEIFDTIVAQLAEADEVPSGILPLVDPDHQVVFDPDVTPGGIVSVGDEPFLPLPVNDQQLKIIRSVDTQAQTVVQGPPGTGKTHTAAALLSHLLAQGKRVLVTAHTDRALQEVRQKLPDEIRPLSVAVVGSSRSDFSDLRTAVDRIASRSSEHDPDQMSAEITSTIDEIGRLRSERSETYAWLLHAREHEVAEHQRDGYTGTLAALAQERQASADQFEWISQYADVRSDSSSPLTDDEAIEWLRLLRDTGLTADETDSNRRLVELDQLPSPDAFAQWCDIERGASAQAQSHAQLGSHEAFEQVRGLPPDQRAQLQQTMRGLADEASALEQRDEGWMNGAVFDVRAGREAAWQARAENVRGLIGQASPLVDVLGPLTQVEVTGGDVPLLRSQADGVRAYLADGGTIKTLPDGRPKSGMLTSKAVKNAAPLFEHVRVNGLPPTQGGQLDSFVTYVDAESILDALDRAWPVSVTIPDEDTLAERLNWHVTELAQLNRVLLLGHNLQAAERHLASLGIKAPTWTDLETVRDYARLVDAATAHDALDEAATPLQNLADVLGQAARWDDAGACVADLVAAVENRDHRTYVAAFDRLTRLHDVRRLTARRDALSDRLAAGAPGLRDAVRSDPGATTWNGRLTSLGTAWQWAALGSWILLQQTTDVNVLQDQISTLERRIRWQVERLAALRAWGHALAPDRLTGRAKADLVQYAQLVKRLGKGTGKYAAQQRGEIRTAMERCRSAVPVWIMPTYRIAEQFRVEENMFDVVLVDEASQAGLDAAFLQYLAPKIVVIGDDKQVSPSAVGVDQQQLRHLADQYLADDRYKATWQDPKQSLFNEALKRYGGHITLVEHRRCVPEIIGFSNQIAYEPDGVRLIPVRQYGADRLDPIKVVHVSDGYASGTTSKVNQPEVDAIVEQIEKCLADPRYDGLTMGVISLQGTAQARRIESALLERIAPEEWNARELRCGDAPDFQGSERDVMFLSMVAAAEPGSRLYPVTQEQYVQRYNVAASRAKDQMWVFHSMALSELGHPEDMRFRLLDYCYGVTSRADEDESVQKEAVPEDNRVEPFDSLFEQRVFNRLYDRGYSVIPQYQSQGYSIDLVVVGAKGRLAIECDGDRWHGPEKYEHDLARQRDLERCGWRFHRIRESAFYLDQAATLADLWAALDGMDIRRSGCTSTTSAEPMTVVADAEVTPTADAEITSTPTRESPSPTPTPDMDVVVSSSPRQTDATQVDIDLDEQSVDEEPAEHPVSPPVDHGLAPYTVFEGTVAHPETASRDQLITGLVEIVSAEGPVVGQRLQQAYVKAAGGHRVGKLVAKTLNSAITAATRRELIIADNPTNQSGIKFRTYRLPDQAPVRTRVLGPRSLEQVPPNELAALLHEAAGSIQSDDERELFKAVLDRLGLRRLTTNVEATLNVALAVAASPPEPTVGTRLRSAPTIQSVTTPPSVAPTMQPHFAVIDVETTGLSADQHRIVEIAVVTTDPWGRVLDEWGTRINPQGPVGATHIHGISSTDVADAPVFADIITQLSPLLAGAAIAAHNARFDLAFLRAEYARAGWDLPYLPALCTLEASEYHLPALDRRRLADCSQALGFAVPDAHSALGDARATAALLAAFMHPDADYPPLAEHVGMPIQAFGVPWPAGPSREPAPAAAATWSPAPWQARVATEPPPALVELIERFSLIDALDEGAPSGSLAYLEKLAEVLEDGETTAEEAADLAALAETHSLTDADIAEANQGFVLALAHEALDDGKVTQAERAELQHISDQLGVDQKLIPTLLDRAANARHQRLSAGLAGLPPGWPHGEPLRVGDKVAFTGCDETQRTMLGHKSEELGVRIMNNVSGKTAMLVTDGTMDGTKAAKARELGVRTVHPDVYGVLLAHLQPALAR